jgi:hypothetical protein
MSELFGSSELSQLETLDSSGVDSSESLKELRDQTGLITKKQRQAIRALLHQIDRELSDFNMDEDSFKSLTIPEGSLFMEDLIVMKENMLDEELQEDIMEEYFTESGAFE